MFKFFLTFRQGVKLLKALDRQVKELVDLGYPAEDATLKVARRSLSYVDSVLPGEQRYTRLILKWQDLRMKRLLL